MTVSRRSARMQLALLIAVFAMPVVASWLYFQFATPPAPEEGVNFGHLIRPARPLADVTVRGAAGGERRLSDLRGKWSIVYLAPGDCDMPCQARVEAMYKTRLALGEDSHRVQLVLLAARTGALRTADALSERLRGLVVLGGGEDGLDPTLVGHFTVDGQPWLRTYLIDPLGNLMMYYEPGTDPKGVLRDLRRLLKASRIG